MRVGTYNVYGLQRYPLDGEAPGPTAPLDQAAVRRFAEAFAELDCDLLALQEGHQSLAVMQAIAKEIGGVSVAAFPSPVNWPGYLLSRHRILESRCFSHHAPEAKDSPLSRCAGAAIVDVGDPEPWAVLVMHLHPRIEEAPRRELEARLIDTHVGTLLELTPRVVVMGDFNCEIDEAMHRLLKQRGLVNAVETVGPGLSPTTRALGADRRAIDHIYVSAALAGRLAEAEVVRWPGFYHPGPDAAPGALHSDHLPVVAALSDAPAPVGPAKADAAAGAGTP